MENRVSAFTNDALGDLDATGIAEAIRKKEISVQEATEAAIQRAEKVNPSLDAIKVKAYAERQGKSHHTHFVTEADLTYVAVDEQRKPRQIPLDAL